MKTFKHFHEFINEGMLSPKDANKLSIGSTLKTDRHTYTIVGFGNRANAFKQFEVEDENGEKYNIQVSLRGSSGIQVAKGRSLNFPEQEEMLESILHEDIEKDDITSGVRLKQDYKDLRKGQLVQADALDYSSKGDDEEIEVIRPDGKTMSIPRGLLTVKI
jgi:hypothetical protein